MYYFNNNINPEKRNGWRNASEIKAAAIEHEKRRYQMIHEFSQAKRISKGKQQSGWIAALFSIIK